MSCAIDARGLRYRYPNGVAGLDGVDLRRRPRRARRGARAQRRRQDDADAPPQRPADAARASSTWRASRRQRRARAARRASGSCSRTPTTSSSCRPSARTSPSGRSTSASRASEVRSRVAGALAAVRMEHVSDRAPHQLSLGQRRRVAIATVLAMQPRLLVLDEPSANLDPRARRELLEVLDPIDRTMLVVTHDLPFAARLCERAVILSGGRIVADGPCARDPRRRGRCSRSTTSSCRRASTSPASATRLICTFRPMADVAMPRLSDSMEEGTILKWLKSDGDEVSKGEELVEIETDKANMTYEADQEGTLKIVAQEGDTLAVGETIASIGGGQQRRGGRSQEAEAGRGVRRGGARRAARGRGRRGTRRRSRSPSARRRPPRPSPTAARTAGRRPRPSGRTKASPVARRMARELGLELAQLQGTGPGGRIVKADVEAAAKGDGAQAAPAEEKAPEAEPEPEEKKAPPAVVSGDAADRQGRDDDAGPHAGCSRRSRAGWPSPRRPRRTSSSTSTSTWRRRSTSASGSRRPPAEGQPVPSFNDFVVKASALALVDFPRANGAYRDGKFELYSRVNVGVAVAGQDALVVPTVFDADSKSLGQIAKESRALAERVRAGAITPPELSSGTFTVSNLGHVRDPELHGGHQPAAGGDPGRRRDAADAGRARRRGRGPQHHAASRSPATTGSSTAPTPPSSSAASASGSRTRSSWRSDGRPAVGRETRERVSGLAAKRSCVGGAAADQRSCTGDERSRVPARTWVSRSRRTAGRPPCWRPPRCRA